MIVIVWAVLAAFMCGGIYGAARILARDDMPLTDLPAGERGCSSQCSAATTRPAVILPGPDREVVQRFSNRAGEPAPGGNVPEWVQALLLDGDIEAAVARDVAHCQRMAAA